ncbi:MAG TPA: hypothetical protein VMV55_07145 [Methanoregula sp.]|nr:hypothetical protein [Methanoregula sp.]
MVFVYSAFIGPVMVGASCDANSVGIASVFIGNYPEDALEWKGISMLLVANG